MKTVLVTGGRGMLAHDLIPRLASAGLHVSAYDLPDIDITDLEGTTARIREVGPACIINCAAYTAVDKAESEPDAAFAVNRDGAGILASICATSKTPLLHVSTDFIFDGTINRPYREDDPASPLSIYGRSKWEGEKAIRAQLARHIIVRTSWLYGSAGNNFVKTMLRLARERKELRIVDDQYGCPTWSGHLADALVNLCVHIIDNPHENLWGTYHYCNAGNTTWCEMTRKIIEFASLHDTFPLERITPIATEDYPTPATRPKWSVMDTTKISQVFDIHPPPWESGISAVIDELYS